MVVQNLGSHVRVVVLWRQRDDDAERWVYLERTPRRVPVRDREAAVGGGAYRIRLFGAWDRPRRQEKYITQVAFWIHRGFPPTPVLPNFAWCDAGR